MAGFNFKQFLQDNFSFIKNEAIVFVAALVAPVTPMLILIGMLILVDTFSGIYAAIKTKGFAGFKSRLMSDGILPKIIFYPAAIIIAQAMETIYPEIPIMKTTGFMLMSVEAKSISENYKAIFGISIFDSLRNMVAKEKKQ